MIRAGRWAGSLALACALLALVSARAEEPPTQHSSSWWNWWSWGAGPFGLSLGGVSYGADPDRVTGSDQLVHQPRTISGARAIELRGPIDVIVKQGPVEKLTLHTDENIAPLIETTVQEGVLRIGVRPGASFRTAHAIVATVEVPHLDSLKTLDSGDVTCAEFDTELLQITVRGSGGVRIDALRAGTVAVLLQGSGDVHLSGTAAEQGYVVEGSGGVDADELAGREVAVRVAGSGDVKVWASEILSVDISGSGDVRYHGQPAVTKTLRGSGSLIHR